MTDSPAARFYLITLFENVVNPNTTAGPHCNSQSSRWTACLASHIARSRDLVAWEESPVATPILGYPDGNNTAGPDHQVLPGSRLDGTGPWSDRAAFARNQTDDINRSDMDFVTLPNGVTYVVFTTGNQGEGTPPMPGMGFSAAGIVHGTSQQWLESYFDGPAAKTGAPCELEGGGSVTYNGICVPNDFPPYQNYSRAISHPTYLEQPPTSVNITVGRQLFVDQFLIQNMSDTTQTFHAATYHQNNPVVKPDQSWEGTYALPYSGGVFWEDAEQRVALWYRCGSVYGLDSDGLVPDITSTGVCVAYSHDGIHFKKPLFNDVGGADCQRCNGTNMVRRVNFDGNTIWLDKKTTDPSERYKMATIDQRENFTAYTLLQSPDGRHWTVRVNRTGDISDNSRIFYNPFRQRWVFSVKTSIGGGVGRARAYWETPLLWENVQWRLSGPEYFWKGSPNPHRLPTAEEKKGLYWNSPGEVRPWTWADIGDDSDPEVANPRGNYPQLNGIDTVAYESIMIGMYSIMQCLKTTAAGQPDRPYDGGCRGPENNERDAVFLGWSREGFQWSRPPSPRVPFTAENSTGLISHGL
jgi:hypothetical protein